MEKYKTEDGETFNVSEKNRDRFLSDHPDAVQMDYVPDAVEEAAPVDTVKFEVGNTVYNVNQENQDKFFSDFEGQTITEISKDGGEQVHDIKHISAEEIESTIGDSWWSKEENAAEYLTNHYQGAQGLDVKFVEAKAGYNTLRMVVGGIELEGFDIDLTGNTSWADLQRNIELKIEDNFGAQDKKERRDEVLLEGILSATSSDNILDYTGGGGDEAEFYNTLDKFFNPDKEVEEYEEKGLDWVAGVKVRDTEKYGNRLSTENRQNDVIPVMALKQAVGEVFSLGNYDQYVVDANGGVTINVDGEDTYVPYTYIWDKRKELQKMQTLTEDSMLYDKKVEIHGSEEGFHQYISDNAYIYLDDPEEVEIRNKHIQLKGTEDESDRAVIEAEINGLWKELYPDLSNADIKDLTLYDKDGEFISIRNPEGEDPEAESIAREHEGETGLAHINKTRAEKFIHLVNLSKRAQKNKEKISGETNSIVKAVGGAFDFSNDAIDKDFIQLKAVSDNEDIFIGNEVSLGGEEESKTLQFMGSQPIGGWKEGERRTYANATLSELPGESDLAKEYNIALREFKTWSRAADLNLNINQTSEENLLKEWVNNVGESFVGAKLLDEKDSDEARDAWVGILEHDGYEVPEHIIESSFFRNGSLGKGSTTRKIVEGGGEIVADLAPLLLELAVFKKLGGLKKLQNVVGVGKTGGLGAKINHGLIGRFANKMTNPAAKWVTRNMVAPGVVAAAEWSIAESAGELVTGGAWRAHTIDWEKGETNFTMPIAMGMSGGAFGIFSQHAMKVLGKSKLGNAILPKLQNPDAWLNATKGGARLKTLGAIPTAVGQGATATVMLLVAETAQAIVDEAVKQEDFAFLERWKEITDTEHIISTWFAMTVLSGKDVAPKAREAFRSTVAGLKRKSERTAEIHEGLGTHENSSWGEINSATKKKIDEIHDSGLSIKETNAKVKEVKQMNKDLKLDKLIENSKKAAEADGKYYEDFVLPRWQIMKALSTKPVNQWKAADYKQINELKHSELYQVLIRSGVKLNSKEFKRYENIYEIIKHKNNVVDHYDIAADIPEFREEYIQKELSVEINENRIKELKERIKKEQDVGASKRELKKLQEANKVFQESLDTLMGRADKSFADKLNAEVAAAEVLARSLGATIKTYTAKEWEEKGFEKAEGNYNDKTKEIHINLDAIKGVKNLRGDIITRGTRNLGTPMHEVIHHVLRNSLKGKDGKVTKQGIEIIDGLMQKFSKKERAIIQKRIDDNYRYEENLDGSFRLVDGKKVEIEGWKEKHYEEYVTGISDAIKNQHIKYDQSKFRKIGRLVYPILGGLMPKLYNHKAAKTSSAQATKDLYNMLGDLNSSSSKQVQEGLKTFAAEGMTVDGKGGSSSKNKDVYQNDRVLEELGITKESTKKIIEKNREIENKIVEENIRDTNGNLQASTRNQQKLVENNMAASFKLALEASNKAKYITLEEGLKYDDVNEWFSEYNMKLVDLARTYRAERVVDPKTGKAISPPEKVPFGAYVGGLLPKKYSGILEAGKSKIEAKSMSDANVAKQVGKMTAADSPGAFETNGRTIKVAERLGPQGKRIKDMVMKTVNLIGEKPYSITKEIVDGKEVEIKRDLTKATFKSLKNVVLKEIQKEIFGIDPKAGNLSKPDVKNAQMVISKHAELFIRMLPEHHTIKMVENPKTGKMEARPDRAIGIENVLLEAFYNKGVRKDNLTPWTKKKNIKTSDFLEVFGVTERGVPNSYKKDSNTSSRIHALVKQVERMVVNQSVREKLKEMGFGKEEWFSTVAEGRSEGFYSKNVYRNEKVAESTIKDFDYKQRTFHREIGIQGLTPEAIGRAYDITYGKDGLKDVYGVSLRKDIIKDYKAFLKPYVTKKNSYTVNKEKFPVDVAEYLASVSIPDAAQAVAKMFDVKESIIELFKDTKSNGQFQRYQEFNTDMLSDRINRKIEDVVDSKEIEHVKDQAIVNEFRGKSHLENGDASPKRRMAFYKVDGLVRDHFSKIPGYENLTSCKRGGGTIKHPKRYIELGFKGKDSRRVEIPESSKFDGEQKTTQEMVNDSVSKTEMTLRKENAQFHWDRVNEILEGAAKLIENKTYGNEEVAMLISGLLGNMKTSLRSAALFKYAPVNPPTRKLTRTEWNAKKGEYVEVKNFEYEHGVPAKDMAIILTGHYFFGKKIDLQKLKDSYSVGVVHVDFNKNFGEVFQKRMQFGYKIGDIPPKRWFNEWTAMGEAHMMRDIYTGEIYGEAQVNYWNKVKENHALATSKNNKLVKGIVGASYSKSSSKKVIEDLRTIDKAIKLGRNPNKENKGMSAWDFDDTLATTKSGVRARIPNTDGLPKPSRKVIFLAGGAGSGKSNVVKKLNLEKQGFKLVNSDISLEWLKKNHGLPENMVDLTKEQRSTLGKLQHESRQIAKNKLMKYEGSAEGVVVDGTGGSIKSMEKLVNEFKEKGYDVSMVFVETSLPTALARNKARVERSLLDVIVEKNHAAVQGNKSGFKTMFGERFMEVKTDKLKQGDAMPKDLVDKMHDFVSGYEKIRLDAEQFATEGKSILERGGVFDFGEFNVVTKGEKGPFFQKALDRAKKFGLKDQFVLTARPAEAALPIYEFLKSQGLEIPLENITGLGNSTGEAKAMWMLEKFSEGYNDMYFADDAMQNVKAVKDVLDQLDVKSKVQQAVRHSKNRTKLSKDFNKILEEVEGVKSEASFGTAKGVMVGRDKGKYKFGTPGMEDFSGLVTYAFAGKGKAGEAHKQFFHENLQKPFNRAYSEVNTRKQNISEDYKALRKAMPEVKKQLNDKVGGVYNVAQAIRVYNFNKAGYKVPGLSKADLSHLIKHVEARPELTLYADQLSKITLLKEGYIKPTDYWLGENIAMDMNNVVDKVFRKEALGEFVENRKAIFGEWKGGKLVGENMNKIEAIKGPRHREALENMLWRMENGTNRSSGTDAATGKWMNWINSATGTIMFFNQKSAALQTISSLNYVNGTFNNPLRAAQAFANQPQYWKDFVKIFNSDMLLQRRSGLKINIEAAELLERVGGKEGGYARFRAYVLEKGFIPTKYADSFAIASGGATFYRNSIRKYKKQGLETKEAEKRAFEDFAQMTEATQQSSRPDLISMQQASGLGRPILAFANTPMQMFRRHKRRLQDIVNNRGNMAENVASAAYYGFAQTMIFSYLANAMFATDDESDDQEDIDFAKTKELRHVNTITDSYLRGMGLTGATIAALKNGILSARNETQKANADYGNTIVELLNISPPIGSKVRKLYSAGKTYKFNKDVVSEMGLSLDNPATLAVAKVISATTNLPVDRVVQKLMNLKDASNSEFEYWERLSMFMGLSKWSIGAKDEVLDAQIEAIEERVKKERSEMKKIEKENTEGGAKRKPSSRSRSRSRSRKRTR